jgi:hypothetical protein
MKRVGIHSLKLVYPPISNQEGAWLYSDSDVKALLNSSKLYILAQREELLFTDYSIDENRREFVFCLNCGSVRKGPVAMPLDQFDLKAATSIEIGPKLFKIIGKPDDEKKEPLYWCTPDVLLNQWFNGQVELSGLDSGWDFVKFKMHYVGISKKNDSFERLFRTGHEKRTAILTHERQIAPAARVSDELMIFMFHIDPLERIS